MKALLTTTSIIEAAAGVALLCFPSAAIAWLLGSPLETPAAVTLGRVAGTALLALGLACWFARYEATSCAARGLVSAMVLYNLGATVILTVAGIQLHPVGVLLWPAVVLHAAMVAWCVARLARKRAQIIDKTE